MAKHSRWTKTSWPWELEIIVVFFVLLTLFLPFFVEYTAPIIPEEEISLTQLSKLNDPYSTLMKSQSQQNNMVMAFAVVGLYVGYLVISFMGNHMISTTITDLISPTVFAAAAYYRLSSYTMDGIEKTNLLHGTWWEPFLWISGTAFISLFVARLRRARHLRYFEDENWELDVPTAPDPYRLHSLRNSIRSFLFPVSRIKVSENGILILGHLYILPISFKTLKSVVHQKSTSPTSNDFNLATRSKDVVRIQTEVEHTPYIISPVDSDAFIKVCHDLAPSTSHLFGSKKTSHGTSAGT